MGFKVDETGNRYGRYVVQRYVGDGCWECVCDCGTVKVVRVRDLRSGTVQSCGCLNRERHTTHGMAQTRLYRIWVGMLARAGAYKGAGENSKRDYQYRGISVCDEWLTFENFRDWALSHGYSDDLEIDRIDNDRGYCPENCRWVLRKENANNRRCTVRLEDGTSLAMFCPKVGIQTSKNGKVSKQYSKICEMYRCKHKAHPELIAKANDLIALYKKTLALLKLLEDVRQFASAADVQKLLQTSSQESV